MRELLVRTAIFAKSLFPERQVFVRTNGQVRYLTIGLKVQAACAASLVALVAWLTWSGIALNDRADAIAERDRHIANLTGEYGELSNRLSATRASFLDIARRLNDQQQDLTRALEQRGSLQERVDDVAHQLARAREQRDLALADRERLSGRIGRMSLQLQAVRGESSDIARSLTDMGAALGAAEEQRDTAEQESRRLADRVASAEARIADLEERRQSLERSLTASSRRVDSLVGERDRARGESNRLEGEVVRLEDRLAELTDAHQAMLARIETHTDANIGALERMLALTGLDVEQLVRDIDTEGLRVEEPLVQDIAPPFPPDGVGGPMLPPMPGGLFDDAMGRLEVGLARWSRLNRVLTSLPLALPVEQGRVTSRFGNRTDPFTRRRARHEGLDFSVAFKAPVLATGPGKVVRVGWFGPYGRVVDIEHAFGLTTRYAHMWRTKARVGQTVQQGDIIGLAGSSGRSSGVHVHYEVHVDGSPVDPERFLKAGSHVLEE